MVSPNLVEMTEAPVSVEASEVNLWTGSANSKVEDHPATVEPDHNAAIPGSEVDDTDPEGGVSILGLLETQAPGSHFDAFSSKCDTNQEEVVHEDARSVRSDDSLFNFKKSNLKKSIPGSLSNGKPADNGTDSDDFTYEDIVKALPKSIPIEQERKSGLSDFEAAYFAFVQNRIADDIKFLELQPLDSNKLALRENILEGRERIEKQQNVATRVMQWLQTMIQETKMNEQGFHHSVFCRESVLAQNFIGTLAFLEMTKDTRSKSK